MVVAVTRCITPVGPFLSRLGPCCVRRGTPRLTKVLGVLSLTAPWPPSAQGTLPVRRLFDAENMLLAHPDAARAAASDRGALPDWRGRLRDPWDEQVYGVPALWLFDRRGQVVSPPFRGSRYFNGGDIQLPYALSDVDAAIASALAQDRRASKSHAARVGSPHHGRLRDRRPAKVLGVSLNLALWGSGDCQFRVSSSRGHALV